MEMIFVVYFLALAFVAIFRDNAEYIKHEIILKNIPDSIIKIEKGYDDSGDVRRLNFLNR